MSTLLGLATVLTIMLAYLTLLILAILSIISLRAMVVLTRIIAYRRRRGSQVNRQIEHERQLWNAAYKVEMDTQFWARKQVAKFWEENEGVEELEFNELLLLVNLHYFPVRAYRRHPLLFDVLVAYWEVLAFWFDRGPIARSRAITSEEWTQSKETAVQRSPANLKVELFDRIFEGK